ncbi:aaa family ATPase [Macrophomina phaseolina MS6]|uniref:Aaa family ATPase n=1 Tax=Macrophomina phaseolina (strain MS6) TaxID=1126212 RepID=K2QMX3_MACPH|nr:aaa family ATPase [Macrophomina phaseolina MS6]
MSSPASTSQTSQRSSQDTLFLLPDVYSESNHHKPTSEGAAAKESIGHSDSPAALRVPSRKGSKDESQHRVAGTHSSVEDGSAAEEPLTSNTLDELEAELSKPTEVIGQSPKADSLLDDVENEFETKLAKAMVRRSEYYPASSDESDAFASHRRKKSLKAKKDPEQAAAIKLRIEALENMMTELMESSGTSPSIHDKDEGNPAAAVPQSPDIMVLPTAAYAKAVKIPSSIEKAAEVRVPSPAKQENKAPSTPPRLATQPDSAEPAPTQSAFNIIPNFNPVAWLQRRDSPQEEKPDLRPSPVSSLEPVPVKQALLNLASHPAHATPALPKHSPPRSPPQSIPVVKQPSAPKMKLPVWASPGYNGPLPELIKIASPYLSKVLSRLMGGNEDWFSDQGVVLCRPYRPLLRHEATFRRLLAHLEDRPSHHALGNQLFEAVFEDSPDGPATLKALLDLQDAPVDDQALFYTQLLVNFIEYCLKPHIARVTSEDFQDISFPDLWYLFKPGGLVVSANEDQAYRVIEVVYRANAPGSMASFGVKCVHMDYDGQKIGPVISLFWVGKYFGKRNVATLPVYPLRCNDDPSGLQRILVDRGRKSMKAIISRHMHCMGATLNDLQAVNGQVMIDFEGALAHNSHWRPEILSIGESLFDKQGEKGSTEDNGPAEFSSDRELASEYLMKHELTDPYLRSRKMAGGEASVSDDELMLLTHRLFGFILRTRKWGMYSDSRVSWASFF